MPKCHTFPFFLLIGKDKLFSSINNNFISGRECRLRGKNTQIDSIATNFWGTEFFPSKYSVANIVSFLLSVYLPQNRNMKIIHH